MNIIVKSICMKTHTAIICISMLFFSLCRGQEITKAKPCIFVDENRQLFINEQLPVYLWLSISPEESAPAYLLTSDSSKSYSNPMYFDTEGINTIHSAWAVDTVSKKTVYPQIDVVYAVYSDGRPPLTKIKLTGKNRFTKEGIMYFRDKVGIELSAIDAVSGISSSFYSINGKPYKVYSGGLSVTDAGTYSIGYYSIDKVGNTESVKEKKFVLEIRHP
jgi:hypothetical protein